MLWPHNTSKILRTLFREVMVDKFLPLVISQVSKSCLVWVGQHWLTELFLKRKLGKDENSQKHGNCSENKKFFWHGMTPLAEVRKGSCPWIRFSYRFSATHESSCLLRWKQQIFSTNSVLPPFSCELFQPFCLITLPIRFPRLLVVRGKSLSGHLNFWEATEVA